MPTFWDHHNVTYTTPEGLNSYRDAIASNGPLAAVLLVDPACHVHKARDWFVPGRGVHDRPQRIADFRADLESKRPPAAVSDPHQAASQIGQHPDACCPPTVSTPGGSWTAAACAWGNLPRPAINPVTCKA